MFYVMANFIAKPSHEFIETGQNWIKNFKLSNFAGEHVPTANSRIKAVVEALSTSPGAVPPTSVDKYLAGMLHCSNEEFKILVQSLMGSYNNPIDRVKERFSIPETLDLPYGTVHKEGHSISAKWPKSSKFTDNRFFLLIKLLCDL